MEKELELAEFWQELLSKYGTGDLNSVGCGDVHYKPSQFPFFVFVPIGSGCGHELWVSDKMYLVIL